jgi:hypothetical protein
MKPIISIHTLGPHPLEAALCAAVSKDGHGDDLACGRPSRRARKRALLRTRFTKDIDVIRTRETLY